MGCTQTDEIALPEVEISFDVLNSPIQTKADGDTDTHNHLAYYADGHFGTFAWFNASESAASQVFMENQEVSKNASVWKAVGKTYYWPHTGTLDFISYSPYLAGEEEQPTVTADAANGISIQGWKVNPAMHEITYLDDLMYADKAEKQSRNVTTHFASGVPTLFHHALAKLNFKVTYDDSKLTDYQKTLFEGIKVTKLEMDNIYSKGDFTYSAKSPSWSNHGNLLSTAQSIGTQTTVSPTDKTKTVTADYLVLPQTIPSGKNIKITYQLLPSTTPLTAELKLGDVKTVPSWNMNTIYTYNIIISPLTDTPILFTPTVNEWTGVGPVAIEVEEKEY